MMIKHMILDHLPPCSSINPLALDVSSAGSMELRCGNKASAIKTVSSFTTNQKRPVNLEVQILGFHVVSTVQHSDFGSNLRNSIQDTSNFGR